jgi:hypothetical protein
VRTVWDCPKDSGRIASRRVSKLADSKIGGVITVVRMHHDEGGSVPEDVVAAALRILNYSQFEFRFDLSPKAVQLRKLPAGDSYLWAELAGVLEGERSRLGTRHLVGVLGQPIENNWFSRSIAGKGVTFMTTWSWEYISHIPVEAFIAYGMIRNLVETLLVRNQADQEWFYKEVVHTGETRGCLSDMCVDKPQMSFKMRSAYICADCLTVLRGRLPVETIDAVISMLETVRLAALWRREQKVGLNVFYLPIAKQVDEKYPFPIAYCLRVMRSEQLYTRKWLHMYDLYRLCVKYLTFCLLADRQQSGMPRSKEIDLSRLAFAQDGQWGWMAFALAEELQRREDRTFFVKFSKSFDSERLEAARSASKSLVKTRNEQIQGHGFTPPEPVCQEACERHFADLKTLLNFIKPLASYELFAPAGAVQPTGAKWRWGGKRMMGSNPVFHVEEQVTTSHPSSGCVLLKGNGDLLSLHPWLLLNYCPVCYREMVFLYDRLEFKDAIHREYPTNHNQKSGELAQTIRERFGLESR